MNFYEIRRDDKMNARFCTRTHRVQWNEQQNHTESNFNQEVLLALSTPNDECFHCTQKSHFNPYIPIKLRCRCFSFQ